MNIVETKNYSTARQVNRVLIGEKMTVGYILVACNMIGSLQYGSAMLVALASGRHYTIKGNDAIALELQKVVYSGQVFITEESYQEMIAALPARPHYENICYILKGNESYIAYKENLILEGGR